MPVAVAIAFDKNEVVVLCPSLWCFLLGRNTNVVAVPLPVLEMLHHTAVHPHLPGFVVVATEVDHVNGIGASPWSR